MNDQPDIYESCQTRMRFAQPDVLDHLLELNFIHVPTQKVLKRAKFFVQADEPLSKWIQTHPTFQKGCWPLGLMALHEWFWKIKFLEVDGRKVLEGGTQDPKVGITHIRAEFEDLDGEGWFVPLVNFANTHVLDQLKQFYADEPHAFPQPKRISTVMDAEMEKLFVKHKAVVRQQMQHRSLLKVTTAKARVFIDESGDVGFRQVNDVYAFAPVIVPDDKYEAVSTELRSLLTKHWGKSPPKEIHMTDVPASRRDAVRDDLARIIIENDIRIVCFAMQKWPFIKHLFRCHATARFTEEHPLNLTWNELIADKDYFLQANFLSMTVEEVVSGLSVNFLTNGITADFFHDRKRNPWMNDALHAGFATGIASAKKQAEHFFGLSIAPHLSFAVADSESEPCLWLSDWIANELRAWFHHKDLSPAFEKSKQQMLFIGFDEHGVKRSARNLGGHGEDEFPDLPREIIRGNPVERERHAPKTNEDV